MDINWNQVAGVIIIIVGIVWCIKRTVPVGIEGRPPSFYVEGKWAIVLGALAIILGLFLVADVPTQIKIDKCLDEGGSFNYESKTCEYIKR